MNCPASMKLSTKFGTTPECFASLEALRAEVNTFSRLASGSEKTKIAKGEMAWNLRSAVDSTVRKRQEFTGNV